MSSDYKRKTLVDIDLSIWAEVKHFATIKKLSVNDAVQLLLRIGLSKCGYNVLQELILIDSGESLSASSHDAPSPEVQ